MGALTSLHLFFFILTLFLAMAEDLTSCPTKCNCTDTALECPKAALSNIPQNVKNADNLTLLNMAMNNLTSVREVELASFKNLHTIDLSKNSITLMEDRTFVQLTYLEYLDMSYNMLTSLPNNSFIDLPNLTSLDLRHNHLLSLGRSFCGIPSLMTLNLAENVLTEIPLDVFDGTSSLVEIDLSWNKLFEFPSSVLDKVSGLRTIVLSGNQITKLGDCALGYLESLENLQLESNSISFISEKVFWPNCDQNLSSTETLPDLLHPSASKLSLKAIDLTDNLLSDVPNRQLSFLPKLQSLNLNANHFVSIEPDSFRNIHSLLFVSVSYSLKLQSVENGSFVNLHSLSTVYLHDCPRLTNFSSAVFNHTPNLNDLRLHGNGLKSISKELLTWGENITMTFVGNPFQCDCHLQWMPGFYNNSSTTNRSKLNLKGVKCSYPDDVKGLEIVSLHPDQFHCRQRFKSVKSRFHTAVVAASICGVLGLLLLLFLKFRNRICIVVKRQFRYKAHRNNRELFSVKLSEIMIENDPEPFYDDSTKLDLRPFRGHDER